MPTQVCKAQYFTFKVNLEMQIANSWSKIEKV